MKLYDTLLANTEGATIDPLTYKPRNFKHGYAVSLTDNAFKPFSLEATRTNARKLKAYAKRMNLQSYYLGYWLDKQTGTAYLDLSIILQKKAEAMTLARIFNQKAIFNFSTMESVYLTA